MQGLIDGFSMSDAFEVNKIEKVTNHDVKAVEYFLKQRFQSHPEIAKIYSEQDTSKMPQELGSALSIERERVDDPEILVQTLEVFCTKKDPSCKACPMRGECSHYASALARWKPFIDQSNSC